MAQSMQPSQSGFLSTVKSLQQISPTTTFSGTADSSNRKNLQQYIPRNRGHEFFNAHRERGSHLSVVPAHFPQVDLVARIEDSTPKRLLDFTPELFRMIIYELITEVGPCRAWKLRGVCKTLDKEIRRNLAQDQPRSTYNIRCNNLTHNCTPVQKMIATDYLFERIQRPRDANPRLLDNIKAIIQYLRTNSKIHDKETIKSICKGVTHHLGPDVVLELLWYPSSPSVAPLSPLSQLYERLDRDLPVSDHIAAAIFVDSHDLLRVLILSLKGCADSLLFGNPFHLAQSLGKDAIAKTMLDVGLVNGFSYRFVNWVLRSRNIAVDAILWTITNQDFAKIHTLVESIRVASGFRPTRTQYNKCLVAAIRTGSEKFVIEALKIPRWMARTNVSPEVFNIACKLGVPEVVTALLCKDGLDPNTTFAHTSPLIAAVKSKHLEVMKAVLEAGADVNAKVGRVPRTALDHAFDIPVARNGKKREAAVRLLLSHGAKIQKTTPMVVWPQDFYEEYQHLRGSRKGYVIDEKEFKYIETD